MLSQAQIGRPWILTIAQGILGLLGVFAVGDAIIAIAWVGLLGNPDRTGFVILLGAAGAAFMIGQAVALAIRSPWSWIAVLVAQALVAGGIVIINALEPNYWRLLIFPGGIIVILLLPAVRRWFFSNTPSRASST